METPEIRVDNLLLLSAHVRSFDQADLHATLEKEWRVALQAPLSDLAFVIARRHQHLSEFAVRSAEDGFGGITQSTGHSSVIFRYRSSMSFQ